MQNDKKANGTPRKEYYTIESALRLLKWTSRDLLMHVNATAKTRVEKIAYGYWPNSSKKRDEYVQENYKPVSRVTIYRAINKDKLKVSEYIASLIKEALVLEIKRRKLGTVEYDQILIDVYRR